jgi:hypothetical protein
MSEIIKFKLASGEFVYVDAEAEGSRGPQPAGRGGKAIEIASETFETALESVKPSARAVVEAFREFNEPAEIGLEFGIQFKSSANAFVLTGEATAAFKLSLKWKSDKG